jgi:ketosteroid isomerase-like protein
LYDAFSAGDVDALKSVIAEDAYWIVPGESVVAGTYRGRAEILGYFGDLRRLSGSTFHVRLLEIMDGSGGAVALAASTASPGDDAYVGDYLLLCQSDGAQITSARPFVEDQKRFDAFWGPKTFRS